MELTVRSDFEVFREGMKANSLEKAAAAGEGKKME